MNIKNSHDRFRDVGKQIIMPVATSAISISNPALATLIIFLFGTVSTINDWKHRRLQELCENISEDSLLKLLDSSDEVKNVFFNVAMRVFEEPAQQKRKYYYNYINNIADNHDFNFNYHSKVVSVLLQILPREVDLLINFKDNYSARVEAAMKEQAQGSEYTQKNLDDRANNLGLNYQEVLIGNKLPENCIATVEYDLVTLTSYGLIHQRPGRVSGPYYGPITEFGHIFVSYVLNSVQDIGNQKANTVTNSY